MQYTTITTICCACKKFAIFSFGNNQNIFSHLIFVIMCLFYLRTRLFIFLNIGTLFLQAVVGTFEIIKNKAHAKYFSNMVGI